MAIGIQAAGILLTAIFLFLSGLHMYWAAGGRWGMSVVLPTVEGKAETADTTCRGDR